MAEHSDWRDCNYTDEKQKSTCFVLDTNPQPRYLAEGLAHSRLASCPSDQLVLNRAVNLELAYTDMRIYNVLV
jgi:hypothetical protein